MNENVIELKNVRKEFVTTRHHPGWKGAVKGLFTKEKETKVAVDDVSLGIKKRRDCRLYREQWGWEIYYNQDNVGDSDTDSRVLCGKWHRAISGAEEECRKYWRRIWTAYTTLVGLAPQ